MKGQTKLIYLQNVAAIKVTWFRSWRMKYPMAKISNCLKEESEGYNSQEFEMVIIIPTVI